MSFNLADKMSRALRRYRNLLAELMAHEENEKVVKNLALTYGCELFATGDLIPVSEQNPMSIYYAEMQCGNLNELMAFTGALKAHYRCPERGPCDHNPWEE